jgi:hypothetical protein
MPKIHKIRKIILKTSSRFKKEFKRQTRLAIAAAIGFLIAFAWKDFIFNLIQDSVADISKITDIYFIGITSALILTILGVLFIMISSKLLD